MNRKLKKFSIISVALFFCLSGCAYNKTVKKNELEVSKATEEISKQNPLETTSVDVWIKIGEEIRKLDDIYGIEETAITVNEQIITKKEIETQAIYAKYLKDKPLNDYIKSIIRDKVVKAEAVRVGIEPPQESIDEYLNQVDMVLEENAVGTETIFALMEGMEISKKEYLSMLEQTAYDMYQRESLWKEVESKQEGKTYEEYVDTLVENATVKVLDFETLEPFGDVHFLAQFIDN